MDMYKSVNTKLQSNGEQLRLWRSKISKNKNR